MTYDYTLNPIRAVRSERIATTMPSWYMQDKHVISNGISHKQGQDILTEHMRNSIADSSGLIRNDVYRFIRSFLSNPLTGVTRYIDIDTELAR